MRKIFCLQTEFFLRIMAFSSIQASLCKGIIKKEKFQLVFALFFLSRRSMRKNALKYVFDFMTFSTGDFNLITQSNRFEHCFIPSKVIQYIFSATVIRRREL